MGYFLFKIGLMHIGRKSKKFLSYWLGFSDIGGLKCGALIAGSSLGQLGVIPKNYYSF